MNVRETACFEEDTDDEEAFIPVEEFLRQVPDFILDPDDHKFMRNYDD